MFRNTTLMILAVMVALTALISSSFATEEKEIIVFCGAGFTGAISEIGEIYENSSGVQAKFNFDGLPALRVQLNEGAYADVLISPDRRYMDPLPSSSSGFIDEGTVEAFAENKVAVVIPADNPANITTIRDLANPGIKIVMGIKELPIGDHTLQIFENFAQDPEYGPAFKEAVLANVVSLETRVTGVVSKVALGEADAGFAFMSDVSPQLKGKVKKVSIPLPYNVVSNSTAGVLLQSENPKDAQAFIDLLMSDDAQAILDEYGFASVRRE